MALLGAFSKRDDITTELHCVAYKYNLLKENENWYLEKCDRVVYFPMVF